MRARCAAVAVVALFGGAVHAGPVFDGIRSKGVVKVCIWPAYHGLSFRDPRTGKLNGVDIDLSVELASRLGVKLEYIESTIDRLVENLERGRCDAAMQGVGVIPAQREHLRLTRPYLRGSLHGVTTHTSQLVRKWEDIDQPGIHVAVLAGTAMVGAMESSLQHAKLVLVGTAHTCEEELESGRVDVFVSDAPYTRRLLDRADWARLISPPQPFFSLAYTYAVRPGDDEWFRWIDDFVARTKQDGSLDKAADRARLGDMVVRE